MSSLLNHYFILQRKAYIQNVKNDVYTVLYSGYTFCFINTIFAWMPDKVRLDYYPTNKYSTLHNKEGKVRMSQSTCELRPEAEPNVMHMCQYIDCNILTREVMGNFRLQQCNVLFHYAHDGKRKVPPAQQEGTCTFGRGVMKK